MYSLELDLTSKKSFALVAKNLKKDLIKSVNEFSFNKTTKDALIKTFFELAVGVENLKTHLTYQSSTRDSCDVCEEKGDLLFYSLECTNNYEFVSGFCKSCLEMFLKSKFYKALNKPYLTIECFEKENCAKRMIFTEDSLEPLFKNKGSFEEFLEKYNKLREKFGLCYSCKAKFYSNEANSDKLVITCTKCKKHTCPVCWEEFHPELLCKHFQKEFNAAKVQNLLEKIMVCPFCYGLTRKNIGNEIGDNDTNYIACEECHRRLCDTCYQSIDAISFHGPVIHDINCPKYRKEKMNLGEDCDMCEIKGYKCKVINHHKLIGL